MYNYYMLILLWNVYNDVCPNTHTRGPQARTRVRMHTYPHLPTPTHTYIHTQWMATRCRGHPFTREANNHRSGTCIVFTQHTQSQHVVYTVIIAEQTVTTVSGNECIYQCDQELTKTGDHYENFTATTVIRTPIAAVKIMLTTTPRTHNTVSIWSLTVCFDFFHPNFIRFIKFIVCSFVICVTLYLWFNIFSLR